MRRAPRNLGEKRVLLGSVDKKNNLRITYEKLNIQEKAFISSTQFDRRQLLSRQSKLRQLQNNKGLESGSRPKTRANLPGLSKTSHTVVRSYSNNLVLPSSRNNSRSPRKSKQLSSSLVNHDSVDNVSHNNLKKHNSDSLVDFKETSSEKRSGIRATSKVEKSGKFKTDSTNVRGGSGVHVGDIIAYSGSFSKREKPSKETGSDGDREDKESEDDQISKQTGEKENSAIGRQTFWKNELNSAKLASQNTVLDRTRSLKDADLSVEDVRSANVLDDDVFLASMPRKESAMCEPEADDRLSKDNFPNDSTSSAFKRASIPAETKTSVPVDTKSKESNISFKFDSSQIEDNGDNSEGESPGLPPLVSRSTPSWNGTEALPALGLIRRGSICDVKTFTSGKVLDLLSSYEPPSPEKKGYGQFLEVDNENLKYCRYLRSVTPEEAAGTDAGGTSHIPHKYLPSKNIIIGHTKINLSQ